MLRGYKNRITRLRLRKDIKRQNMISSKEIYKNKNIGSNILYKIFKKLNKNIRKIYRKKYLNQSRLNKDKRQ